MNHFLSVISVKAVRIGTPVKVRENLREATVEAQMERHPLLQQLRNVGARQSPLALEMEKTIWKSVIYVRTFKLICHMNLFKDAEVICATCIGSGVSSLSDLYFPVVIVDGKCLL